MIIFKSINKSRHNLLVQQSFYDAIYMCSIVFLIFGLTLLASFPVVAAEKLTKLTDKELASVYAQFSLDASGASAIESMMNARIISQAASTIDAPVQASFLTISIFGPVNIASATLALPRPFPPSTISTDVFISISDISGSLAPFAGGFGF